MFVEGRGRITGSGPLNRSPFGVGVIEWMGRDECLDCNYRRCRRPLGKSGGSSFLLRGE